MQNQVKKKSKVTHVIVSGEESEQRIDNYLIRIMKGMPKSHLYRLIRKGEVRVNSKRVSPFYRLEKGDDIRLPPVFLQEAAKQVPPSQTTTTLLTDRILYEDEDLMVINKPCGMSVHAGSTVRVGVIEAMRHIFPKLPHLELAHRLDSETSGCLVLAKRRRVLRELHELLRTGKIKKRYLALTKGQWDKTQLRVEVSLRKDYRDGGKHVVEVHKEGKQALTVFRVVKAYRHASLMDVALHTGRTHQIRVHASHQQHPLAGDDRYGDAEFNQMMRKKGLKRMFLHAHSIEFTLPSSKQHIKVMAPLDDDLESTLERLSKES